MAVSLWLPAPHAGPLRILIIGQDAAAWSRIHQKLRLWGAKTAGQAAAFDKEEAELVAQEAAELAAREAAELAGMPFLLHLHAT